MFKVVNIKKNLTLVSNLFGYKKNQLILLKQIHSNKVIHINNSKENPLIEGDALVTNHSKILLGVITADCVPTLIYDKKSNLVAAIHAGWKGAFYDIIQNTVNKLASLKANLDETIAVIGPCIREKNYLVSDDFYDRFILQNKTNSIYFRFNEKQSQYTFNLPKYCYDIINKCGIKNIDDLNFDTYTEKNLFFSCRRSTDKGEKLFGGQISIIGFKN